MDWLSSLLDLAPVRGRLDLRCFYGAPWRIDQTPVATSEIPYHVVLAGSAVLDDPDGGPRQKLAAGDILLVVDNRAHTLHDGDGLPPVPTHARTGPNLTISENSGTGERLNMLCGHFALTVPHQSLLRTYLPSRLIIRTGQRTSSIGEPLATGQLNGLIELMRREAELDGIGSLAMLNAFSAALFALALRFAAASGQAPSGLLALAGHPRLEPALTAMFLKPGHSWTLPGLAGLCGMSRATFARHFQRGLNRSPGQLLVDIRMTQAASELKKATASTAAVAEAVGYQSEAAFQRVFKRHVGMTPAQWRRSEAN